MKSSEYDRLIEKQKEMETKEVVLSRLQLSVKQAVCLNCGTIMDLPEGTGKLDFFCPTCDQEWQVYIDDGTIFDASPRKIQRR